jgi:squalene cyclase
MGTKKRRVMASELLARFQSKEDFISYMTNQLQLYVPPEKMLNRDFMKQLLAEDKKLLELRQVIHCNVPRYDELSVKKFWPLL